MNNLQNLRYALEVEKTNSVSKAAENLYIGQPKLSKAIKELEDSVGITIFTRTPKGMVPTEKGKELLLRAKDVIRRADELESLFRPSDTDIPKFDISVPRASYISAAFTDFASSFGDVSNMMLNYRETNSIRIIKNVSNEINRLGIVRYQNIYEKYFLGELDERELRYRKLVEFGYVLAMSEKHPLASAEHIDWHDLAGYTELVHGDINIPSLPISEARQLADTQSKKNTITLYERASQFELLSEVTTTFMPVSRLPDNTLKKYSLVQKECDFPDNTYTDMLIFRKGYRPTDADRKFFSCLEKSVRKIFGHGLVSDLSSLH